LGELQVAQSGELSGGELDRVREIYLQAFGPHHRVPFEELTATGPVDLFLVAMQDGAAGSASASGGWSGQRSRPRAGRKGSSWRSRIQTM
jgi:hypothetical protein